MARACPPVSCQGKGSLGKLLIVCRYILQANLLDWAGGIWITAFNEVAEQLVGISANDLMKLRVRLDPESHRDETY